MKADFRHQLGQELGVGIARVQSLAGGDTCQSMRVDLNDGSALFVKTIRAGDGFSAEVECLRVLETAACLRVPKFIGRGLINDTDWLALEYLELQALNSSSGALLGEGLAELHRASTSRFGWSNDNYLGRARQRNSYCDNWPDFFCENRLGVQRSLAALAGFSADFLTDVDAAIERARQVLAMHNAVPSLLHGDLWAGNAAALATASHIQAVVFDPASYYGDRETDLAMTELFGGFPPSFYHAYETVWPRADGYPLRRDIYQLYHLLNHAVLFGGSYKAQAQHKALRIRRSTDW